MSAGAVMKLCLKQPGRRFLDTDGEAKPGLGRNAPFFKTTQLLYHILSEKEIASLPLFPCFPLTFGDTMKWQLIRTFVFVICGGRALDITLKEQPSLLPLEQHARHVHEMTDRFSLSNTYIIEDGHLIVVDPTSVLHTRLTLDYLRRYLHRSPTDIDLIVLTHLHPEHSGGLEELRQACRAPVAASVIARHLVRKWQGEEPPLENSRSLGLNMVLEQALHPRRRPTLMHQMDLLSASYARQVQMVDLWLEDVEGLPNHPDWRVVVSPGHTPESLCLYNPFSYELVSGDTIITTDNGSLLVGNGTNPRQVEETLQTLRSLQVHYLYPGHGRPLLARHVLANAHVNW